MEEGGIAEELFVITHFLLLFTVQNAVKCKTSPGLLADWLTGLRLAHLHIQLKSKCHTASKNKEPKVQETEMKVLPTLALKMF